MSVSDVPTGTLTFLLTDIAGSSRMWENQPEKMRHALVRHSEPIAGAVERHGGNVICSRGEGDSLFAVFQHAPNAVRAAAELQQALFDESWPEDTSIRVRAALHTGSAYLAGTEYN